MSDAEIRALERAVKDDPSDAWRVNPAVYAEGGPA